jgi:putative toxin-antitoxin system antitoxin component (TIGR02293 family)
LFAYSELMNTQTTARRQVNKKGELRDTAIAVFWDFSTNRVSLEDSERLLQIKAGFSSQLLQTVRIVFELQEHSLEQLLDSSISTLKRRSREQKPLNAIASERLDRVAVVCLLAEKVFQKRNTAACWMSKPNYASVEIRRSCSVELRSEASRFVGYFKRWNGEVLSRFGFGTQALRQRTLPGATYTPPSNCMPPD